MKKIAYSESAWLISLVPIKSQYGISDYKQKIRKKAIENKKKKRKTQWFA